MFKFWNAFQDLTMLQIRMNSSPLADTWKAPFEQLFFQKYISIILLSAFKLEAQNVLYVK